MDIKTFRQQYPEFADVSQYSDPDITYYLTLGTSLMSSTRWGTLVDIGIALFIAHNLVMEKAARNAAANGGVPGATTGPVASKSVGSVSVSYDTGSGIEADAGHWNNTIYGTRLVRLMRMVGAGGVQITC